MPCSVNWSAGVKACDKALQKMDSIREGGHFADGILSDSNWWSE